MRELARAVVERRRRATAPPADLLDVVVGAAGEEVPAAELAEVFLSSLFAIAGSVGFTLGWSVYLAGTHPEAELKPAWVVREALRLWPIAWMLGRRPTRRHVVAGVEVTPRDLVVVCPYLVHRHPRYWEEPERFLPERWGKGPDPQAFIPFGWGPHTCAAASLSLSLVESALAILFESYHLDVRTDDPRPCVGPALAPPRFSLRLTPRRPSSQAKGGE
jgi:cytochrome P450